MIQKYYFEFKTINTVLTNCSRAICIININFKFDVKIFSGQQMTLAFNIY